MVQRIIFSVFLLLLGTEVGLLISNNQMATKWVIPPLLLLFALAVIWGDRVAQRFTNWLRATLNKEKTWLFNMEQRQRENLPDYLSTLVHRVYYSRVSDSQLIGVKVELVNLTVFTIDIEKIVLDAECSGYSLGVKVEDTTPRRQVWGSRPTHELQYHIKNKGFLSHLKKVCSEKQRLSWNFHITWDLKIALYGDRHQVTHDIEFKEVPEIPRNVVDALQSI